MFRSLEQKSRIKNLLNGFGWVQKPWIPFVNFAYKIALKYLIHHMYLVSFNRKSIPRIVFNIHLSGLNHNNSNNNQNNICKIESVLISIAGNKYFGIKASWIYTLYIVHFILVITLVLALHAAQIMLGRFK